MLQSTDSLPGNPTDALPERPDSRKTRAARPKPLPAGTGPFSRFEWMLAGRYLRARRREAFISVIAGFSFIGIMLGVATLIIVMAVMNGFRAQLIDKILGLNGHLIIQAMDSPLTDYDAVSSRIVMVDGVASAIPLVEGQALASGTNSSSGVLARGIRDVDLPNVRGVAENIQLGSLVDFEAAGGVAIGTRLAASLGLTIGSNLTLVSPNGNVTPLGVTPRIKAYPVTAIFEIGMSEYDSSFVFMPFGEAQAFFNLGDEASAIEIYLDNADLVGELRPAIERAADRQILLTDWQQRNVTFFSALEIERNVMFLILSLIILIAALNIISGLTMLVKEKGHAIAILRTMGATRGAIMRIFFIIGSSIGAIGTFAGFLLGVLISVNIETIREWIASLFTTDVFSSELYFLSQLPADLDFGETASVIVMTLGLSFLATLYPAWSAARLDPVEALRYE
ncbi:lipoprotein-releasing system permease protein [Bauldia litoralis]|uniref:Lipoprotein-releasing system permease protein n=2 Tax=Bauldia litoralis TaxID=665467 RepID=A0A1G6AWN5_9HYPH|nr:lipoprotein-releasing system permease protein [Bauldia litoralis]